MSSSDAFEPVVERYLSGAASLRELEAWLAAHELRIDEVRPDPGRSLTGLAWGLIWEHDTGACSEDHVRAELRRALDERDRVVDVAALSAEVRDQIQSFIDGRLPHRELEGWLDCVSEEVHASGDPALRRLTDRAFTLLAEMGYGDRTLDEVRTELTLAVRPTDHQAAPSTVSVQLWSAAAVEVVTGGAGKIVPARVTPGWQPAIMPTVQLASAVMQDRAGAPAAAV